MQNLLLVLLSVTLFSCTRNEDRLSYGITSQSAEKQLTKSAQIIEQNQSACVAPKNKQVISNISVDRKNKMYVLRSKNDDSIKRISIYHESSGKEMGLKWESSNLASVFARLKLGKSPSCFYLKDIVSHANTKGDIKLFLDRGLHIDKVVVSLEEYDLLKNCNYQKQLKLVQEKYLKAKEEFTDKNHFIGFIKSLIPVLKRRGCKRPFDTAGVPMWWLCGHYDDTPCNKESPANWFRYIRLQENRFEIAKKFLKSYEFKDSLDGALAEEFSQD